MTDLYDQNEYGDSTYDPEGTPATEAVRATYATDYYMTDVRGGVTAEQRAQAFDRWLAAHDAEVRASVVPEEPEWEYGVTHIELPGTVFGWLPGDRPATHRRRKAGPWLPVEGGE